MIYANVCIIYSAETALSKENRQASGFEYEYYIFKFLEAMLSYAMHAPCMVNYTLV